MDFTMCGVGACGFRDVWRQNVQEGFLFLIIREFTGSTPVVVGCMGKNESKFWGF